MALIPSPAFIGLHRALQMANSERERLEALTGMEDLADPAGLPHLLDWIHHENEILRRAAERAAGAMIEGLLPRRLIALESRCRESWTRYLVHERPFRASSLPRFLLATLDPNGRIREPALRKLAAIRDPLVLPFMLLRLNDWVPVVRELADLWLARHANELEVAGLIRSLPVLAALSGRRISAASRLLAAVTTRPSSRESVPQLFAALECSDSRTRRFVFQLLRRAGAFADASVQQSLIQSRDRSAPFCCSMSLRSQALQFPEKSCWPR